MEHNINGISLDYEDAIIRIFTFHISAPSTQSVSASHEHKFYELHFASEGSYNYSLGDKSIPLKSAQMLIIPPDLSHMSVKDGGEYKFYTLSLHLSQKEENGTFYPYFKKILNGSSKQPIDIPKTLIDHAEILCQQKLYSSVQGGCKLKSVAGTFIYELFSVLDQFRSAPTLSYVCDETARAIFLKELVNNPFYKLSEISEAIGYSSRHTARLIRETYGKSLTQIRKEHKKTN